MLKPKALIPAVLLVMLAVAIQPTYSWLKVESAVPANASEGVAGGAHSGAIDIQLDTGASLSDETLQNIDLADYIPEQGKPASPALFSPLGGQLSVVSAVARNNSSTDSVVRLNLKGVPATSSTYGESALEYQSVLLQVRRLKGWNSDPDEASPAGWLKLSAAPSGQFLSPNHDALTESGFVPGSLAKGETYDYSKFYDEYATTDLAALGLEAKAFVAVASILEDGSLAFGLPNSFKALGEDLGEGSDFLYAYLPPKSALVYACALAKDKNFFDNTLQYAMFSLPLTLYEEDSYSEGAPQIAAYGVQANREAIDAFFGQGAYDALETAIIPPSLREP